jgi:hypothetical protein
VTWAGATAPIAADAHRGELRTGVAAIVESAADLMADARYFRALSVAKGDPDLAKLPASPS